ncbi:TonB-dependent hemin, ferrichrome receptor [Klebsiella pneumoniae]|nr:TonB-dependent hemin, ferrichrome receptor [Klebsiella pneumoniae]
MPDSVTRRMQTVNSNYDTDTWGLQTALAKTLGRHDLSAGFNASTSKPSGRSASRRSPAFTARSCSRRQTAAATPSAALSRIRSTSTLIATTSPLFPAVRVVHQSTKPENLSDLAASSSVLSESSVANLYGKNSDTQVLPSLTFQYDLTPRLMTYLQYQRGAQFPNASQLYGSWNLAPATPAASSMP